MLTFKDVSDVWLSEAHAHIPIYTYIIYYKIRVDMCQTVGKAGKDQRVLSLSKLYALRYSDIYLFRNEQNGDYRDVKVTRCDISNCPGPTLGLSRLPAVLGAQGSLRRGRKKREQVLQFIEDV